MSAPAPVEPLKRPGLALALLFPGTILLIFLGTTIFGTGYFEHFTHRSTHSAVEVVAIEEPQAKCPNQKRIPVEPVTVRSADGVENYYCVTANSYRVGDRLELYLTDAGRAYDFSPVEPNLFLGFMAGALLLVWRGGDRLFAKARALAEDS